ncbi:hypothetical protein Q8F55_000059 [Vanrija albida]|uniref:F-box domain-containing protein n=1 Tax=Vanrija albida TaxID=181172 RepID=A0ABR3QC64_9TREE
MVTIDHTAHPHILDLVLTYAPPKALLALRATSKEFQRRVDAPFAHAVLKAERTATGYNEALSIRMVLTTATSPPRPLPWFPFAIQTLDQYGQRHAPSGGPNRPQRDPARLTRLHTLRRFDGAFIPPEPAPVPQGTTVVDFVNVTDYARVASLSLCTPPGTARSITHLKYDQTAANVLFSPLRVHSGPQHPREMVFVLWPTGGPDGDDKAAAGPLGFLYQAVLWSLQHPPGANVSVTVVGMETADEEHRDSSPEELWDHMLEYVLPHLDEDAPLWMLDPALSEAAQQVIRFVTLEEWWYELGDRREVDGVLPPAADGV